MQISVGLHGNVLQQHMCKDKTNMSHCFLFLSWKAVTWIQTVLHYCKDKCICINAAVQSLFNSVKDVNSFTVSKVLPVTGLPHLIF